MTTVVARASGGAQLEVVEGFAERDRRLGERVELRLPGKQLLAREVPDRGECLAASRPPDARLSQRSHSPLTRPPSLADPLGDAGGLSKYCVHSSKPWPSVRERFVSLRGPCGRRGSVISWTTGIVRAPVKTIGRRAGRRRTECLGGRWISRRREIHRKAVAARAATPRARSAAALERDVAARRFPRLLGAERVERRAQPGPRLEASASSVA